MRYLRIILLILTLLLAACQPAPTAPTITPTLFTPPPPTATDPVPSTSTPPGAEHITGSIDLANGLCCAGGETGTEIEVPVSLSATSTAGIVTEMRLDYRYVSGQPDIDSAEWQPFVEETSFPIELVTNWVGFYACVQFKDEAGNLSEVYCDEVSVEGMPAQPSPLLQLEYDLYWQTHVFGELMRFDHETQEVSCLVGEPSECQFKIEGQVGDFDFNDDRSKLLVNFLPSDKEDLHEKLAILDLQSSEFSIFHEIDEHATLFAMSLSPDGMWVAYRQVHHEYTEGHGNLEFLTIRILSTLGADSPAYELECSACKYTDLIWSQDSKYLSFGGWEELWVVRLTERDWLSSTHFVGSESPAYYPYNWSPEFNYLLTTEWSSNEPGDIFVYNYLFEPIQNSYIELYKSLPGVHISRTEWLDGNTLAALEPVGQEKYTQATILYLTEITPDATLIGATTQEYNLAFDNKGFAFLPLKLSETELAFARITQMPDESYWIEAYTFDTNTEDMEPKASCLFSREKEPFSWDWGWTQQNELLFSDFATQTLIIPTDGHDCIDLDLLLGRDFENLNWAP